jgi:hypothetical protein
MPCVGATVSPVPESAAVCGLAPSPPLYAILSVVVRAPTAPGVNTTATVQDADTAIDPPAAAQDPAPEFVMTKSPAFPPVVTGVIAVAAVLELFVSMKVIGEPEKPIITDGKIWLLGASDTLPAPAED